MPKKRPAQVERLLDIFIYLAILCAELMLDMLDKDVLTELRANEFRF
jgi:hypothetical protein